VVVGDGGRRGEIVRWSLDPGVADIGDGIPFCDAAMARVAEYMGQFEGQVPPDDRYGGCRCERPERWASGCSPRLGFQTPIRALMSIPTNFPEGCDRGS